MTTPKTLTTGTPANVGTVVPWLTRLGSDSPHNFSALGEEFLEAAKILNSHHPNKPDWPTFLMICQALELYLKAFLRSKKVSVGDLKKPKIFGHDLKIGFNKAMELELDKILDFTGELGNYIAVISQPYKERYFQYKHSGSWELIPIACLISLVEKARHKLSW